jgi:hypothetical protein
MWIGHAIIFRAGTKHLGQLLAATATFFMATTTAPLLDLNQRFIAVK